MGSRERGKLEWNWRLGPDFVSTRRATRTGVNDGRLLNVCYHLSDFAPNFTSKSNRQGTGSN